MEAVILEPLCDILFDNSALTTDVTAINNELMGAFVVRVGRVHVEVVCQSALHVVGIQDSILCRVCDALCSKHGAEHPRNCRNACLTVLSCRNSTNGLWVRRSWCHNAVSRQEWCQVLTCAYRAHARTTASVRNAEGLVKIQVANVSANDSWRCQTKLGVHVCS